MEILVKLFKIDLIIILYSLLKETKQRQKPFNICKSQKMATRQRGPIQKCTTCSKGVCRFNTGCRTDGCTFCHGNCTPPVARPSIPKCIRCNKHVCTFGQRCTFGERCRNCHCNTVVAPAPAVVAPVATVSVSAGPPVLDDEDDEIEREIICVIETADPFANAEEENLACAMVEFSTGSDDDDDDELEEACRLMNARLEMEETCRLMNANLQLSPEAKPFHPRQ